MTCLSYNEIERLYDVFNINGESKIILCTNANRPRNFQSPAEDDMKRNVLTKDTLFMEHKNDLTLETA